jgi:TP901 family phage tail tape measure protein
MARQIASLYGVLTLKDQGFKQGLTDAKRDLGGVGGQLKNVGGQIAGFGAKLTLATAPVAALGAVGIKTASSFEDAMAQISARTGLVGDDLKQIGDFALQMGADTAFSAQEAADAFLQILTSGASAEEAIAMLPAVLDAAAASGEDLGRTADTITDIMASFGLNTEYAADVVDVLARAAGASSADMGSLGQGFANVGGVAKSFGLSVNDTAAILAIFSENGVKGAEAGTQLKSMLLNMSRPTDVVQGAWAKLGTSLYDAYGNMRPLEEVIGELDTALDALPIEQQNELMMQLAGSYGIVGLTALRGSLSISDMQTRMSESASAAEVADARMNTFSGRMDSLKGSVETLMITALTPLMENVLTPLVEKVTEVINSVALWAAENPELATTIALVSGGLIALGPVLAGIGFAITGLGAAVAFLTSPITLVVGAIAALALAWETDFLGIKTFVTETIFPELEKFFNWLGGIWTNVVEPGLKALKDWFIGLWDGIGPALDSFKNGLNTVFTWVNDHVITPITNAFKGLFDWATQVLTQLGLVQNKATDVNNIASEALQSNGTGISYMGVNAPGKAMGGPVAGGKPHVVGEFGPELFVPQGAGTIVPNGGLGGTSIQLGQVVIYANSRAEGAAAARGFADELKLLMNEAG